MQYKLKSFIQILILMYQNKKNILLLNMKIKKLYASMYAIIQKSKKLNIYFEIMKNRG